MNARGADATPLATYPVRRFMTTETMIPQDTKSAARLAQEAKLARRQSRRQGLFAPDLLKTALWQSLVMLRPDIQWKNPVMFVVEVGMVLSILYTVAVF